MKKYFLPFLVLIILIAFVGYRTLLLPIQAVISILGFDSAKEYIVLFQNNMELRASGGFIGSFARIRVKNGKVSLEKIEDIYVPDGQLQGHVDPPWPIEAAFGQGWYKLRDSNWNVDFPTATQAIEWFFEHGKEPTSDGIIAVNLEVLRSLLLTTGPVALPDEAGAITKDNFYKRIQAAVEIGFFPGSIQKRTFLGNLGKAVFTSFQHQSFLKKISFLGQMVPLLSHKDILLVVRDVRPQEFIHRMNWDGSLQRILGQKEDYFSFFETNLGANKANCCIVRTVDITLGKQGNHAVVFHYVNTNPSTLKQPPQYWGGAYVNFLRVVIPLEATITALKVGDISLPISTTPINTERQQVIEDLMKTTNNEEAQKYITNADTIHQRIDVEVRKDLGLQIIGFFVFVDALNTMDVTLHYTLPVSAMKSSSLTIQKQSGINTYFLTLHVPRLFSKTITQDTVIQY